MSVHYDIAQQRLTVTGALTFDSVAQKIIETDVLFQDSQTLEVDLSQVSKSDSAGLALLIHWLREAHQRQKTLTFSRMPQQMLAMAQATGLEQILPLHKE